MSDQLPGSSPQHGGIPRYDVSPNGYGTDPNAYGADPREGEQAAQVSLILGIVGLFILGIVLGPLAIWQASKAERLGKSATAGKVLGWIDTIFGIVQIVLFFTAFGTMFAIGSGM